MLAPPERGETNRRLSSLRGPYVLIVHFALCQLIRPVPVRPILFVTGSSAIRIATSLGAVFPLFTAVQDTLREDQRRALGRHATAGTHGATVEVDVFKVECVDVARKVSVCSSGRG